MLQSDLQNNYEFLLLIICIALFLSLWGFYFNCLLRKSLAVPFESRYNSPIRVLNREPFKRASKINPETSQ